MLYEYESVFYLEGPDSADFNWYKWTILDQPAEALIKDFKNYELLQSKTIKRQARDKLDDPAATTSL